MATEINNDPLYWTGASFMAGILFSSLSWGIVFYFIFLLIWSIAYYFYSYYHGKVYYWDVQIGLFIASLFGFLIGRAIIEEDDHDDSIKEFGYKCRYWMERLDLAEGCEDLHDYWQKYEDDLMLKEEEKKMRLREKGFIFYSLSNDETESSESKDRSSISSKGLASDSIDSVNLYKYNRMI